MPRIPSMNGRCGLDGISHCLPSRELYFPHKAQPRQTPPTLIDSQNTFYFQHTGNPFVVTLKRKAKNVSTHRTIGRGRTTHLEGLLTWCSRLVKIHITIFDREQMELNRGLSKFRSNETLTLLPLLRNPHIDQLMHGSTNAQILPMFNTHTQTRTHTHAHAHARRHANKHIGQEHRLLGWSSPVVILQLKLLKKQQHNCCGAIPAFQSGQLLRKQHNNTKYLHHINNCSLNTVIVCGYSNRTST